MGVSKIGFGVAGGMLALAFAAALPATAQQQAAFVKTVDNETQCLAQEGSLMDLQGAKHCLVAVIPDEIQDIQYAGELRGVTECPEKQTRKTQIGDFCLIALEPIPAKPKPAVMEEPAQEAMDEN